MVGESKGARHSSVGSYIILIHPGGSIGEWNQIEFEALWSMYTSLLVPIEYI